MIVEKVLEDLDNDETKQELSLDSYSDYLSSLMQLISRIQSLRDRKTGLYYLDSSDLQNYLQRILKSFNKFCAIVLYLEKTANN